MLLRPLALILAVSPVACMKIDWQYDDRRSSGGGATEGLGEDEGALLVDLPADLDLGDDQLTVKLWPVGDCEGTEDESTLDAEDFPYTLIVDTTCDYKLSFARGSEEEGSPIEVLGEDVADAGEEGLIVDVELASPAETETETETETATETSTSTSTGTNTDTATSTEQTPVENAQPGIREFRIAAGTGRGPWNTPQTPIVAKVGETIRIYNDDTITHRLHTNGRPCPHGNDIRPGQFRDCVVRSPFQGDLYDHYSNGRVYFQVTN